MSKQTAEENVPQLKKRVGDAVLQGSNNAAVILGSDRVDSVDSGYGDVARDGGKGAGSVTIVVGRVGSDLSSDDRATVIVSAKSDPVDGEPGSSSATVVADCVRVVARKDLTIVVGNATLTMKSDGSIVIDGQIKLGQAAVERLVKETFVTTTFATHLHMTPVGVSAQPTVPAPDSVFTSKSKGE